MVSPRANGGSNSRMCAVHVLSGVVPAPLWCLSACVRVHACKVPKS